MTIDELARRSGVTTRNLRAYAAKGLLPPPPRLVGRTGYYDARHIQRIQDIKRLLDRGFKTSSIRSLLADWEQGSTLSDALGMDPSQGQDATLLSREQLEKLFPGMLDDPRLLSRARDAGLFEEDPAGIRVPNPLLIEVGLKMTRSGIPLSAALRVFELLVADLKAPARRYAELIRTHVLTAKRARAGDAETDAAVLSSLARVAVASTFARELRKLLIASSGAGPT